MNRIYFDLSDEAAITRWLKSRPAGVWHVLIGTDDPQADVTGALVRLAVAGGAEQVQWLVARLKSGEVVVRVSPPLDLPAGIPLVEKE